VYSCAHVLAGARNDLLSVDVRKNFSEVVQILCRPLTRFEGSASCEVVYRMVPGADSYTETSDRAGGAEDIISVLLTTSTGPGMNLSVAAGTRGGKQDVVVEGTFETGIHMHVRYTASKVFTHLYTIYVPLATWANNKCIEKVLIEAFGKIQLPS
jgi:hypothetical protein